jgi:pyrroline-5-carboxylate reductase
MAQLDVLMIGCGKMGGALLSNWLKGGDMFTVSDPVLEAVPSPARLVRDTSDIANHRFDVIIIAIKPQLIDKVIPAYAGMLAEDGYVLSIAAGCSIARIKSVTDGAPVLRVMPNLPAAVGQGVSAICASEDASDAHFAHTRSLMDLTGTAITVDEEDQIDRFTGIAGSGPGYIFEFARAYVQAAMALGFDEQSARTMVLDTMAGTIEMARSSDEDLEELRNSVTSKGGTTAAGLDAFNGDGTITSRLNDTVKAAYDRALELK